VTAPGSQKIEIARLRDERIETATEHVVVEEPLELQLDGSSIAVTMRTPGSDVELAAGFLVSEGIVEDAGAIATIAHCDENENVIDMRTQAGASGVHPPAPRNFYATSSCGVCGKASIDEVRQRTPDLQGDRACIAARILSSLPDRLRGAQTLFSQTGALHAAGLFTVTGELVCLREDVGRHNAVDKVIGWAALSGRLPLAGQVLLVSGRSSFEIAQKAAMAGIPILAGISGSTSLAVELARECGMTLVAFLRGPQMNLCTHPERVSA
jgi:FdhD protein